jgi:hypothetical protein
MINDIVAYIEAYDATNRLNAEMLEWSKKYVTDKKIDVWQRWNFFCSIAIKDEPSQYIYRNRAMNKEEHDIIFTRYRERGEAINCIDRFVYLFESFEIDDSESQHVKDNWMSDQDWFFIGKHYGEKRCYRIHYNCDDMLCIAKEKMEAILEQQMSDYVHRFYCNW